MDKQPDWNALVLSRFKNLSDELRGVHDGLTQLTVESSNIARMLTRVENSIDKLDARDDVQQEQIDALRLGQHRVDAAVGLTATTADSSAKALRGVELKLSTLEDRNTQLSQRVDRVETDVRDVDKKCDEAVAFHRAWAPWLSALKWVVIGIGGVIVAAVALWLLQDLATSILSVP